MSERLSILIYHRVLASADPLQPDLPDIRRFARQMAVLRRCFHVLPLPQALQQLRKGSLPPRAACITFDDGYADNAVCALPVLQHYGLCATFFIATAYIDGGQMWNEHVIAAVRRARGDLLDLRRYGLGCWPIASMAQRIASLQQLLHQLKYRPAGQRNVLARAMAGGADASLMMSTAQLRQLLQAGMTLGAHTISHPILSRLPDPLAQQEISASRLQLEALLAAPVSLFAYPNGKPGQDYDGRHAAMVAAAGYAGAVSTRSAVATAASSVYELPRFTPWEPDGLRFLARLLQCHYRRPA